MQPQRVALVLLVLVLVLLAVSGLWWRHRPAARQPVPTATQAATPTPGSPTATPLHAPAGYRLAGVAVGEPKSFAVIEGPNGRSTLYGVDADVPGLGRLARIEAERVIVQTDGGQFELWLTSAATPTPTPVRTAAARSTVRRTVMATPRPLTPAAGTALAPTP